MRFKKKRISYWVPFAIILVLLSLIMVYCQSQDDSAHLHQYQNDPSTSSDPTNTSSTNIYDEIELTTHKHEALNISFGIPEDWTEVTMDGHQTFIHSPSKSSAQIQIGNYDPNYTATTIDTVKSESVQAGVTIQDFKWMNNSTYMIIYQKGDNVNGTIYVDMLSFDKIHSARLMLSWPMKYYDRMRNTILAIADSFHWEKEDPFPENVTIVYNSVAKFEFAYPSEWDAAIDQNVYFTQDPQTKTLMTVTANVSTTKYDNMSELDYVNWASPSRNRFALNSLNMDASTVYATSTFSANNATYVLIHYMYASGQFEYIFTFEIPYSEYETQKETVSTLLNQFRTF